MPKKEDSPPRVLRTKWKALILVCRECAACRDGTDPKAVRKALKKSVKEARPRPRVVACGCLGICPKAGVTTAVCGPEGLAARVIRAEEEIAAVVAAAN